MKGRSLALALLLASLSATAAPGAPPLLRPASGGALDACSQEEPAALEGFAPLSSLGSAEPDASSFTCYQLYIRPGFPFRGTLEVTLTDVLGRTASLTQHCDFSGVDPVAPGVVGCTGLTGTSPALLPGTMDLRCSVTDPGTSDTLRFGGWECGAVFGN